MKLFADPLGPSRVEQLDESETWKGLVLYGLMSLKCEPDKPNFFCCVFHFPFA